MEAACVHGHFYGSPLSPVVRNLEGGQSVLMILDVQGARSVRKFLAEQPADSILKDCFVDIFMTPPSPEVLLQRLQERGTDSPEVITGRFLRAKAEVEDGPLFKHQVVNGGTVDEAARGILAIMDEARTTP